MWTENILCVYKCKCLLVDGAKALSEEITWSVFHSFQSIEIFITSKEDHAEDGAKELYTKIYCTPIMNP